MKPFSYPKAFLKVLISALCIGSVIPKVGLANAIHHLNLAQATISEEQAASLVMERYAGRILDVRSGDYSGQSVYLVKVLLEDSRVQIIPVSKTTGEILK